MKKLNKIIPIAGYPFDLMISFNEKDRQIKKKLKAFNIEITSVDDGMFQLDGIKSRRGRFVMFHTKQSVLRLNFYPRLNSPEEMGLLQHELFHTVAFFMQEIDTPLNDTTQEVYAYLMQWLTREIYSLI